MSNIPAFTPLYSPITNVTEQKITEFLTRMKAEEQPLPPLFKRFAESGTTDKPTLENEERLFAYAFLKARQWNVTKALKMTHEAFILRKKLGLDHHRFIPSVLSVRGFDQNDVAQRLALQPTANNDEMTKIVNEFNPLFHLGYHYWDRRGLPVLYWVLGNVKVHSAMKKAAQVVPVGKTLNDAVELYCGALVETGWTLCRYQDKILTEKPQAGIDMGAPRRNFITVVVDAKGLNYKMIYKPAVDQLRFALSTLTGHYADCVHRIVVVNCPAMIKFAYGIIKPSLNEDMQSKISFVSPEETAVALDRVIGSERVPSFLGGSCTCPNGCIASYNPNAILSAEEGEGDVLTENIKLSAGEKHERVFDMVTGEDVIWDFVSTKGVDVRFSVLFYPKQTGVTIDPKRQRVKIDKSAKKTTRENPVVKICKLSDGSDHYMAPEDGILQLVWDNSSSWLQDKPIQMRVFKASPTLADPTE